jgi:hypothetical protein
MQRLTSDGVIDETVVPDMIVTQEIFITIFERKARKGGESKRTYEHTS